VTDKPNVDVVALAEAARMLRVSVRAAESALRRAGIRSGYPVEAVAWLRDNRPGRGSGGGRPCKKVARSGDET
jgi:hypothetical protein